MKYVIGIDEAGRGPLAGPVSVGVAIVPQDFDWSQLEGVGDSKKLSEKKREEIFIKATKLKKLGVLNFSVCQSSASFIDKKGIVKAINSAMTRALNNLQINPNDCEVKLDGSLYAPTEFKNQTTIIKGDSLEPTIGLASILAKVTRDRYIIKTGSKSQYSVYQLHTHKGYGTKAHREAIKEYGVSDIHRKSFCTNLLKSINSGIK